MIIPGLSLTVISLGCSQTYGPFARIGPKTLPISDPEYLWKINSVRGSCLESSIDAHVTGSLNLIDVEYLQRPGMRFRSVDLSGTLGCFALDVITDIAFGSSGGDVKTNADVFDFFSNVAAFVLVTSLTAVITSQNHRNTLVERNGGAELCRSSGNWHEFG
ncbi:uncharacterized protein L3040_008115 [Drepanopeziza brunnea f. sp. 'multigermtubi']|uniref:uncharacterized protein n=1 Tax=Drepanopeziza brunnea f. sp. 'multigermtubi' TaxID=698441 RepID=UPI00238A814F|nr:hypothetical protein L3040_008115 [Drepanopeziza brunnea f. sp. 'multigermtubi']